jgi:hypothetical protein
MAIQTRYAGDAKGVNNVDAKYDGTLGKLIATGLTKNPICVKITASGGTFSSSDLATGGIVEQALRLIAIDSTITMYQVDTDRISVLLEATGAGTSDDGSAPYSGVTSGIDTDIATRINTLAAPLAAATVSISEGFKLA